MELCAMQGVGADGFYHVEAALPFPSICSFDFDGAVDGES